MPLYPRRETRKGVGREGSAVIVRRGSQRRRGPRKDEREWGVGWWTALAVIAVAIGVFAIVATASCLRNQSHPWKNLEGVTSISVSHESGCVLADRAVVCVGPVGEPPDAKLVSISVGRHHACGLTPEGSVICWGSDGNPRMAPRGNGFVSISAGIDYACGVTGEGALHCWGTSFSRTGPPDGAFHAVSVGEAHACAIRSDGSVACWGADDLGQSTPPRGTFVSISAGTQFTCGVQADRSAVCWGADGAGQATPPGGGLHLHQRGEDPRVRREAGPLGRLLGTGRTGRGAAPGAVCLRERRLLRNLRRDDQQDRRLLVSGPVQRARLWRLAKPRPHAPGGRSGSRPPYRSGPAPTCGTSGHRLRSCRRGSGPWRPS